MVAPFENTEEIVQTLRLQFAGLFQNLLSREASLTEAKTAYDLQKIADNIQSSIQNFVSDQDDLYKKLGSTIFGYNPILKRIQAYVGMTESFFFASNLAALDEVMGILNFAQEEVDDFLEDERKYVQRNSNDKKTLILKSELFDGDGRIKDIRKKELLDKYIIWDTTEIEDDDLPF